MGDYPLASKIDLNRMEASVLGEKVVSNSHPADIGAIVAVAIRSEIEHRYQVSIDYLTNMNADDGLVTAYGWDSARLRSDAIAIEGFENELFYPVAINYHLYTGFLSMFAYNWEGYPYHFPW